MSMLFTNDLGNISVSPKVIADIAGRTAEKCYGVVGMAYKNKTDGIVNLLKSDNKGKGIHVQIDNEGATVELHIVMQFGLNISSTCQSIANRVRYTLEEISGIMVKCVNIRVEGIRVTD